MGRRARRRRQVVAAVVALALAAAPAACAPAGAPDGIAAGSDRPPGTAVWTPLRVELGGTTIALTCAGQGPRTVVFVAGLAQSGVDAWLASGVPETLSSTARVCAYDRPGLGASSPGPPGRPRTVPANVEELALLLDNDAFGGLPVVLVGQGYGAFIARQVAKDRLRVVSALVLVDPPLEPLDPEPPPGITPGQAAEYAGVDALNADLGAYGAGALPPPPVPTEVLGAGDRPAVPADAPASLLRTPGTAPPDPAAAEHRRELQRQLAQKGAFGRFRSVPDSGSLIQFWQPAAVVDAVRAALSGSRAGR